MPGRVRTTFPILALALLLPHVTPAATTGEATSLLVGRAVDPAELAIQFEPACVFVQGLSERCDIPTVAITAYPPAERGLRRALPATGGPRRARAVAGSGHPHQRRRRRQ